MMYFLCQEMAFPNIWKLSSSDGKSAAIKEGRPQQRWQKLKRMGRAKIWLRLRKHQPLPQNITLPQW
jgi:hypothetical protein